MAENDFGQYLTTDPYDATEAPSETPQPGTTPNISGDNGEYLQPVPQKAQESGVGVGEYLTTENTQRGALPLPPTEKPPDPTAPSVPDENPPEYCEVVEGIYDDIRNSGYYTYIDQDPNRRPPLHTSPHIPQGNNAHWNPNQIPGNYQSLVQGHPHNTPVIQSQPGGIPPPQVMTSGGNQHLQPGMQVLHVRPGDQVMHQGATFVVEQSPQKSNMAGHIAFSCFVFWCCNALFGAIAFFVAIAGLSSQEKEGRKLGWISLGFNIAGIVITVVAIATIIGVTVGGAK